MHPISSGKFCVASFVHQHGALLLAGYMLQQCWQAALLQWVHAMAILVPGHCWRAWVRAWFCHV
jgi:hypothetical protein